MNTDIIVQEKLEHLFRREYGKICASLSHRFGIKNIQIIEDSVQDALIKAMKVWGYTDIPANPSAWLYKVASNRALDILKRENKNNTFPQNLEAKFIEQPRFEDFDQVNDDLLKMIFATCHPLLSTSEQIMLSLKLLCGFNIDEISRALLKQNEAVKKSLTRAKIKFRTISKGFEIPQDQEEQTQRLEVVLKVLYLMFNEGYKATSGQNLMKSDVCEEAVRLTYILSKHPGFDMPQVNALLALMCFNLARFSSRQDPEMHLVTLKDQDRRRWDRNYINMGVCFLSKSAKGGTLTKYHLESGIASLYIMPANYKDTKWSEILRLYDLLVEIDPSLSAKLNRIVVLSKVLNCKFALNELNNLRKNYPKIETHLFFAIRAELERSCEQIKPAIRSLHKAIELSRNDIEKKFLEAKLKTLRN